MNEPGRILALDYGKRKVGAALSDPLQITAAPLATYRYDSEADLMQALGELIQDYDVRELVVGIPYTMAGGTSEFTGEVMEFIERLRSRFTIPIQTVDERMSSQQAKETLIKMGVKTGHNKERVDSMAAAHLLRYYLEIKSRL